jgi:hypothetical protein
VQNRFIIESGIPAQNLAAATGRDGSRPEQGCKKMAFRKTDPGTMMQHFARRAGHDIESGIIRTGNGVSHPFVQTTGFGDFFR